ncbi:MAG: hypothetical protein ACTSRS_06015 [Candidatus Helarchaeota archaeon]
MESIDKHLTQILNKLQKILQKGGVRIPAITELYPMGIRANLRVRGGPAYYLVISPQEMFVKKGTSAVDLNLEAEESFWLEALTGTQSLIAGLTTGKLKVRGLRSSFLSLILLSSLLEFISKLKN